jgi:hypothetical protein
MRFRQKKTVAAGRRIQVFLDTNKDRIGPVDEGGARAVLNEVVANLEALGGQQDPTRYQRRRELQDEANALYDLREVNMRPIAKIADVSLREVPEFDQLSLPPRDADTQSHIMWAREMAKAAEPHQATFVTHGMSQDFIAKLNASADAAQKAIDQRWRAHTSRVGATAKLHSETRRAVGVFEVIDAMVVPKLKDDDQLLRDWKLTKKVAVRAATAVLTETAPNAEGASVPATAPATPAAATPATATPATATPATETPTTAEPTAALTTPAVEAGETSTTSTPPGEAAA